MINWRKVTTIGLVACLLALPLGEWGASLQGKAPPNPTLMKHQVDQLGVGAKVKVKLEGGKKLEGYIETIDDEGFLLNSNREASPRRIAYDQVARLKFAKRSYRASGQPDPVEARRTVIALGVGQHVMVKVAGGKKLRGHIEAIEEDHFILLRDHESTRVAIPYAEVQQVGKNLSKGVKIAIVVGGVAVLVVAIIGMAAFAKGVREGNEEARTKLEEIFQ